MKKVLALLLCMSFSLFSTKYPCSDCNQEFTHRSSRNRHIHRDHKSKQSQRFKCPDPLCSKTYSTAGSANKHYRTQHIQNLFLLATVASEQKKLRIKKL